MGVDKSQNKFVVLRVAKLKSALSIIASSQHNLREVVPKNTDSTRLHLNENLYEDRTKKSQEIFDLVHERVASADKVDNKATPCIEYVISASAAQMAKSEFNDGAYFRDALAWIEAKHGKDNVVSANIHRDELEPHLHVHVVPIVQREATTRKQNVVIGKDAAGKQLRETRIIPVAARTEVSANHYFGGPGKCSEMQTDFSEAVGIKHGLVRGIKRYGVEGADKIDYKATRTFWLEQDTLRREFNVQKADLEKKLRAIDQDLEVEKYAIAELNQLRGQAAAMIVDMDQKLVAVALDRKALADGLKKLADEKAEHLSFVNRIKIKLDQREEDLNKQEANMVHRFFVEKVEPQNAKIAAFHQERDTFREEMKPLQGYAPGQVVEFVEAMQKARVQPKGPKR